MLNIILGTWGLSITPNKLEEHYCVALGGQVGICSRLCVFLHSVVPGAASCRRSAKRALRATLEGAAVTATRGFINLQMCSAVFS